MPANSLPKQIKKSGSFFVFTTTLFLIIIYLFCNVFYCSFGAWAGVSSTAGLALIIADF